LTFAKNEKDYRRKSDVYPVLFWQQWQHQDNRQHGMQKVPEAHFGVQVVL